MTLIEMRAVVHAIARRIDVPELNGLTVATQRSPNLAASVKVGIGIHFDANNALALFRREYRMKFPRRTDRTLRSQFANKDGRRAVGCRIILCRIKYCDIFRCHIALLSLSNEAASRSKYKGFEFIHYSYLINTFLPPMMFRPR